MKKTFYACLTNTGFLRIYMTKETAETKKSMGVVVPVELEEWQVKGGYPVDKDGNSWSLYAIDIERHSREIPDWITKLYKECLGEAEGK